MTKYIKYHKNYTEFGEPYQLVLPLNLEGLVPDDDSVRLLSHELEELDYSLLYQAYSMSSSEQAEKETATNIAATIRNNFFIVVISLGRRPSTNATVNFN